MFKAFYRSVVDDHNTRGGGTCVAVVVLQTLLELLDQALCIVRLVSGTVGPAVERVESDVLRSHRKEAISTQTQVKPTRTHRLAV
jgi:hypothetical protein